MQSRAPVSDFFWLAGLATLLAVAVGAPLDGPWPTFLAATLMLLGGLPHGAFDIALAVRAFRLDLATTGIVLGLYVAVALLMATLWSFAPTLALGLFLMLAAIHFGEDWTMLEPGLLRAMAGASIITAPAIGQPHAVSALFELLANGSAGHLLAQLAIAIAPVALLVTAVGLAIAWRDRFTGWALAQSTSLLCLLIAPPVIGFAIYFVLLHSPRHLGGINEALVGWSHRRLWLYGGCITAFTLAAAALSARGFWSGDPQRFAAEGFRLLSIVAAPHLLLSIAIDRHLKGNKRASRFMVR